jgi:hypothetical protein
MPVTHTSLRTPPARRRTPPSGHRNRRPVTPSRVATLGSVLDQCRLLAARIEKLLKAQPLPRS